VEQLRSNQKMMKGAVLPTASCRSSNGGGKSSVHVIVPVLVSAGLLALLLVFWISKLAAVGILRDRITQPEELGGIGGHVGCLLATTPPHIRTAIPRGVAMALLHFATTSEVPQQSKEELSATLAVLLKRSPCNFLVYGMWHDSLLWATFNHGGRTVFLDESQVSNRCCCSNPSAHWDDDLLNGKLSFAATPFSYFESCTSGAL
jgi:hypothetical protein